MNSAIAGLQPESRRLVELLIKHDGRTSYIADELGCSQRTIQLRCKSLRRRLKSKFFCADGEEAAIGY